MILLLEFALSIAKNAYNIILFIAYHVPAASSFDTF